ncbi:MAG: response regulator [Chloroflexi bacterium]|nr:response regulator [Chloroflexota bacterium]MBU1752038.1 response regulator [Chloroflexota bacterium]
MSQQAHVFIVDDSKLITQMVEDHLKQAGYQVETAMSGQEAWAKLHAFHPDLVITDIAMPGLDGIELARRIRQDSELGHIPIMMLTSKSQIDEKVAAFEAGADDYLTKPFDPVELEMRVRALLARARPAKQTAEKEPPGQVVTVFSLRGGVGTSTLAVNLAAALGLLWRIETTIVDTDLVAGAVALMTDVKPQLTLADLHQEDAAVMDLDVLTPYLLPMAHGSLRVLAAPLAPEMTELVSIPATVAAVQVLRQSFPYTVIDTGSNFSELTLAMLDAADLILLVLAPEIASLRSTLAILDVFRNLGYPPERHALVLNVNTAARRMLSRKDIESALPIPLAGILPYDADRAVEAINKGQPLMLTAPDSLIAQGIADLAFRASVRAMQSRGPKPPTDLAQKIARRLGVKLEGAG